jgi:hypothetical protein
MEGFFRQCIYFYQNEKYIGRTKFVERSMDLNITVANQPNYGVTVRTQDIQATVNKVSNIQVNVNLDRVIHIFDESTILVDVPAHFNSSGIRGQYAIDDDYVYRCVATDRWGRYALTKNF